MGIHRLARKLLYQSWIEDIYPKRGGGNDYTARDYWCTREGDPRGALPSNQANSIQIGV